MSPIWWFREIQTWPKFPIIAWRKLPGKSGIVGFADIRRDDLEIHDIKVVRDRNGGFWAFLPEKAKINKDGLVLSEGRTQYVKILSFTTKEKSAEFQTAVLSALEDKYPDALTSED